MTKPVESGVVESLAPLDIREDDQREYGWGAAHKMAVMREEIADLRALLALATSGEVTEATEEPDERVPILQEGLRSALDMVEEAAQSGSCSVTEFGYLNSLCAAQVGG